MSEYLCRKIESNDPDKVDNINSIVNKPLDIEELSIDGREKIMKSGKIEFLIGYGKILDDQQLPKGLDPNGDWSKLEKFTIRNIDSGYDLDILSLIDQDLFYQIYINISGSNNKKARTAPHLRYICLDGPINNLGALLGLLHEIGHLDEYEKMSEQQIEERAKSRSNFLRRTASINEMENVLLRERNAWSFALNKLRPFLDRKNPQSPLSKEVILKYIHQCALSNYGLEISKQLINQLKKVV